jgi:Fe-S-cluster containining protein
MIDPWTSDTARHCLLQAAEIKKKKMFLFVQRARASIRKKVRQTRMPRQVRSAAARALADPLFPVTFLLRNFSSLRHEGFFEQNTPRMQKRAVLEIVQQRSLFFLKVEAFLKTREDLPVVTAFERLPQSQGEDRSGYCTHCGGCCEIASGLPEFPTEAALPKEWMRIFGAGLGRNHRFCPFLWESQGRSLCAIHPWRSHPCRTFEKEECDFLMRDPSFTALCGRKALTAAVKSLIRSLDKVHSASRHEKSNPSS